MARLDALEPALHGRARDVSGEEAQLGVVQDQFYARATPAVPGAQWTGVVTSLACAALEAGLVDAVACVAGQPGDPLSPRPVLARSPAEVRAAAGVKPTLSPTLELLPEIVAGVQAGAISRLLFIGVGCQVQALRAVEADLGLEKLFVLGTNCTDNGPRAGLAAFLAAASVSPATAKHYEFHVDYRVRRERRERERERERWRGCGKAGRRTRRESR
jgi:7-hydroxymethyl chlorophyll a reductase